MKVQMNTRIEATDWQRLVLYWTATYAEHKIESFNEWRNKRLMEGVPELPAERPRQ